MFGTTTASRNHYNILSLDGGSFRGTIQAEIVNRLDQEFPSLLRDTDLFVGVSFNSIITLGLAAGRKPVEVRDFYVSVVEQVLEGTAEKSYYSIDSVREILEKYFGQMTLAELDKRVAILTFDLDNAVKDPRSRTWKTKVFHNIDSQDADMSAKVIDVALYTLATPIYFSSVEGFIDGAVVAANPAMVAVAQALDPRGPSKDLKDLCVLSIGAGKINKYLSEDKNDWKLPETGEVDLLNVFFSAGVEVINFQCQRILNDKYHRVNPKLYREAAPDNYPVPFLLEAAQKEDLSMAVGWLDDYWL